MLNPRYLAELRRSIATVAALPCDVLLTPPPDAGGFWKRVERRKSAGSVVTLLDRGACRGYAAAATEALSAGWRRSRLRRNDPPGRLRSIGLRVPLAQLYEGESM